MEAFSKLGTKAKVGNTAFLVILFLLLIPLSTVKAQQANDNAECNKMLAYQNDTNERLEELNTLVFRLFVAIVAISLFALFYVSYLYYQNNIKRKKTLKRRNIIIDDLTFENTKTKQKLYQSQKDLAELENLCKTIIETSPLATCITNRQGVIEYLSPKLIALYGFKDEEANLGANIKVLFDVSSHQLLEQSIDNAVINPMKMGIKLHGIKANKSLIETKVFTKIIYDRHNSPEQILYLIADETENNFLVKELTLRNRYIDAIVNIQWFLTVFDDDENYRIKVLQMLATASGANRAYMFRNSYNELGELTFDFRSIWVTSSEHKQRHIASLNGKTYNETFPRWQKVLAEERIINGAIATFPQDEQKLLKSFGVKSILIIPMIVNDNFFGFVGFDNCENYVNWERYEFTLLRSVVTSLSLYEEKKHTQTELKKSEKYFRSLIQNSEDVIVLLDANGITKYLSPSFEKKTGWKTEERLNRDGTELIHPDDRVMVKEELSKIKTPNASNRFEFRMKNKKGHWMYMETVSNNLLHDPAVRSVVINYRDISARKKTEEILRKSEKRLSQVNTMKDKLFSIVAHDLKNPFNSLINISDLLVKKYDEYDKEQKLDLIQQINDASKSTYTLLENLLQWSRTQTNRIKYAPEKLSMRSIINDNVLLVNNIARNKIIAIKFEAKQDLYAIADENMLNTILRNLLTNSVKYTPIGGTIIIKMKKISVANNTLVEIAVSDNGVGISNNNLNKLFRIDTALNTKGTSGENGTGLGLIICKEFVERNGGTIYVESQMGKGSTFFFTVPAVEHINYSEIKNKETVAIASNNDITVEVHESTSYRLLSELSEYMKKTIVSDEFKIAISQLLPEYEIIKKNLFFDQIIEFAEILSNYGYKYDFTPLITFGRLLSDAAQKFDVETVTNSLGIFNKIVEAVTTDKKIK